MLNQLPQAFVQKMNELLEDEFHDFIKSYEQTPHLGLRVNTLKVAVEDFLNLSPFSLSPVAWTREGFYYDKNDKPGKHPYHEAGLYYIQEPSAMAAVEYLQPEPGEKVLDLCAAPGGKTTQIAAKMKQQGLLIANEVVPSRAKVLSQNVERMGITNCVVLNEKPERLADEFENFFDRVLVDAPCSGEGMFRKDPDVTREWSLAQVDACSRRQLHILDDASRMLRAGGRLVYSTCTFSPEENEQVVAEFVTKHPEFEIERVDVLPGFQSGRREWVQNGDSHVERTIRIWPHRVKGEGHYIAVLRKTDGAECWRAQKPFKSKLSRNQLQVYYAFASEHLNKTPEGNFQLFGEQLYLVPSDMPSLKGLKVIRPGLHLGALKKNRFEPAHSLALALRAEEIKRAVNFDPSEIIPYLKGESLNIDGEKGWYVVQVDGYSIGWGKWANHVLKNHYPKGLRWK